MLQFCWNDVFSSLVAPVQKFQNGLIEYIYYTFFYRFTPYFVFLLPFFREPICVYLKVKLFAYVVRWRFWPLESKFIHLIHWYDLHLTKRQALSCRGLLVMVPLRNAGFGRKSLSGQHLLSVSPWCDGLGWCFWSCSIYYLHLFQLSANF